MRYVSEQFKEKQNQIIRPALNMYFEVATDVNQRWLLGGNEATPLDDFDYAVAPVKNPSTCENKYYYAVVGDGVGVDDPNKMCAPVDNSGFATPNHSVPFGVMKVVSANEEALIGNATDYARNFIGGNAPFVLSFKGGLIPDEIRIETRGYTTSTSWETEGTIYNPDLLEELYYMPSPIVTKRYRFCVKNTTKGGRFQFNWVRGDLATYPTRNFQHIVFENNRISSVSISEETDLTSQALPTYEMTVTCLDVNNEFSPESEHWNKEFSGGQPCFFKVGYESDGIVEYTPVFFGSLSKEPTYDNGKITFYVSIPMALSEGVYTGSSYVNGRTQTFQSNPNSNLNVGDEVDSVTFSSFLNTLFDSSNDIFADSTDENNSLHNYYGVYPYTEARQLTANALGGYIRSGFGTIDLYNTNNVQYKTPDDYLTRYEQVKATLESQAKVGKIEIVRNSNTLSADYVEIEATERVSISGQYAYGYCDFILPFWAIGKATIVNAQSSVSGVTVTMQYHGSSNPERTQADGSVMVHIGFTASAATTIKPIVRFYRVDNTKYNETESAKTSGTETYTNDNELITNTYTADKAKRVAKFISDVSNQYEVDVVQDIRYELGDVIRLETEKNVFKTCVITALKFNLPGSTGHVTCRKIFNLADSNYALYDVVGCYLAEQSGTPKLIITGTDNGYVVVGKLIYNNNPYLFVLGATGITYGLYFTTTITDDNSHSWAVYNLEATGLTYTMPVIDLGNYDSTKESDYKVYGAKTLLMKLYAEQNMTAPINYTNP